MTRKINIKKIQELAKNKNGKCLSKIYINNHSPLIWQCEKEHKWTTSYNSIQRGTWCPKCFGRDKNINDMCKLAKERDGECLSKEYKGCHTKLRWKCNKDGCEWNAIPGNVVFGAWCPICKSLRSEKLCREYLEKKMKIKFPKVRPKWLNGLELDGYNEKYKLAFEYNGEQHYKFIDLFHNSINDFKNQQQRDRRKEDICKQRNISLIKIPYKYNSRRYKRMYHFIDDQLNILGIKI